MHISRITVAANRVRKPESDLMMEAASEIAGTCLRDRVTMPADPSNPEVSLCDPNSGGRLPPVSCAFRGCTWQCDTHASQTASRDDCEHPWDQQLRKHVLSCHGSPLQSIAAKYMVAEKAEALLWDLYKAGLVVFAGPYTLRTFVHDRLPATTSCDRHKNCHMKRMRRSINTSFCVQEFMQCLDICMHIKI